MICVHLFLPFLYFLHFVGGQVYPHKPTFTFFTSQSERNRVARNYYWYLLLMLIKLLLAICDKTVSHSQWRDPIYCISKAWWNEGQYNIGHLDNHHFMTTIVTTIVTTIMTTILTTILTIIMLVAFKNSPWTIFKILKINLQFHKGTKYEIMCAI